jgi:metal-responsive CopG/Arc/MetJ family transcriptional regulator
MAQTARKVAISIPGPLYQAVERVRRASGKTRSAVIQDALRHWLEEQAHAALVREYVAVAPVTTLVRRIPTEVPLGPAEGLPKACVANLDTLTHR